MIVARSQQEIDEQVNRAWDWEERGGSGYPGMTYEQGVRHAIAWLSGEENEEPIPEPEEDL